MSLAKPYRLGSPGVEPPPAEQAPSPEGNHDPQPGFSAPEWQPGAGQNRLLTKSPTNTWPPAAAPARPPFRVG